MLARIDEKPGFRICKKCNEEKELSHFKKDRRATTGYAARCKECESEYCRERHNAVYLKAQSGNIEPKRVRPSRKDWFSKNRDRVQVYKAKREKKIKKQRDELSDWYISVRLKRIGVKPTKELIEIERELIRKERERRELNELNNKLKELCQN